MREHSTRKCFLITKLRAISVRGCNQRTLRCIGLGTVAGNAFVADLSKKLGTIACPRCEAPDGRGGQDCPCPKRAWAYRIRMPVLQLRHKCTYAVQITSTTTRTTEAIPF